MDSATNSSNILCESVVLDDYWTLVGKDYDRADGFVPLNESTVIKLSVRVSYQLSEVLSLVGLHITHLELQFARLILVHRVLHGLWCQIAW